MIILLIILLSVILGLIWYIHQLKITIEQLKFKCILNTVFHQSSNIKHIDSKEGDKYAYRDTSKKS
jgi:hypothetical protein